MARQLDRSFSFNDHDDSSLYSHSESYDYGKAPPSPPSFTDSPTRGNNNSSPPPPPAHRTHAPTLYRLPPINTRQERVRDLGHSTSNRTASTITPGADNMGEGAVGGGIAGVALGVAHTHQRESGVDAARDAERFQQSRQGLPLERGFDTVGSDTPYVPEPPPSMHRLSQPRDPFASPAPSARSNPFDEHQRGSPTRSSGDLTLRGYPLSTDISMNDYPPQDAYANARSYSDNPYNRFSTAWDPRVSRADIDPDEIEDDGEDIMAPPVPRRKSMLGLNPRSRNTVPEAAPVAGGAAAGGVLGALGGLVGRSANNENESRDASGHYGPVGGPPAEEMQAEKSEWLNSQTAGRKRLRWVVGVIVVIILIGAIVGGVIGGIKRSRSDGGDSSSGQSAADDAASGDLNKDSEEIKKLLNNPDLHKVFPGVDYTPFNAQYPECLSNPPSQNNITRDVAVLSQLTNTIRLYGTDCNQTEMVIHALSQLALPDIKIWLGVWLDKNTTTNDRGMNHMYDILAKNGAKPFAGVVVGNEVLYREDLQELELGQLLSDVKQNLTAQKIDLPVATSDLGDAWTAGLAANVDVVMSNIHPFFAGKTVETATAWTWNFWQTRDVPLTQGTTKKNVISEVGWPSGGGKGCGEAKTCVEGSVAGVDEMNTFMDSFVCQSLANGTDFFWFEAFDEPWKIRFNTAGREWEDKWGLMDPGRKLKKGLKIPDCGGKTV
ncbi:MAG: hypothetical protein Q9164_001407 [Protoblastenia rupestris]